MPTLVNMIASRYLPIMTMDDADQTAEMLIHLARLAQSGGGDLTSAQWMALRFFSRANRFSRTPSAFSQFHATTRGTASQTVKSLVAMGLLERHRSDTDGRSVRYDPTPAGRAALRSDPLSALVNALARLPEEDRARLRHSLTAAAGEVAEARDAARFGTCDDCAHLEPTDHDGGYCRCAASMLSSDELGALCVDFGPRTAGS